MEAIVLTADALSQAPVTPVEAPKKPTLTDRGGYTVEVKSFEAGTRAGGFTYNVVQYTTIGKAVEVLGEAAVLAALNRTIAQALSIKAKSNLPELPEDANLSDTQKKEKDAINIETLRKETGGVLLTEDEAIKYIPGQREVRTYSGFMKLAKEAKEAGNIELARDYTKSAIEIMQQQLAQLG